MQVYDVSNPTDPIEVDEAALASRRRLAELLLSQSISGAPVYSNKAGWARAATGLIAGMDLGQAQREQRGLAERREKTREEQYAKLAQLIAPPSPVPGVLARDDEGNQMPGSLEEMMVRRRADAASLLSSRDPVVAKAALDLLSAKPPQEEAYTLAEGAKRFKGGQLVAENARPKELEKEPESVRAIRAEMIAGGIDPNSETGKGIFKRAIEKATTHQPAASMTVNTGKKFGETLATEVAQQVGQSAEAARGAIDTLNTAKQIETAIASGKVMAGPGTSGMMFIQQAIGAPSSEEGRVQTRQVIQGLSQMTMAARKQLKGQGAVSDFEGKLLAKAASGDIDSLTVPEIQSLVKTATRLANGAITQHKGYLQKIQNDPELKGLAPFFDIPTPTESNSTVDELLKKYAH